jgi:hypothetical protein
MKTTRNDLINAAGHAAGAAAEAAGETAARTGQLVAQAMFNAAAGAEAAAERRAAEVFDDTTLKAARRYLKRRDRNERPAGSFDRAGRFSLDDSEHRDCCRGIRGASRAHPYSELKHASTAEHAAHLHGADPTATRAAARLLETLETAALETRAADSGHAAVEFAEKTAPAVKRAAKAEAARAAKAAG